MERAAIGPTGDIGTFEGTANLGLPTARDHFGHAVAGGTLYVIGGEHTSQAAAQFARVEAVSLNSGGNLGTFSPAGVTLVTARETVCAVIGNYLYAIGGQATGGANLSTVERAPINADGNLGDFSLVAGVSIVNGRNDVGLALIGNFLYAIGGYPPPGANSLERGTIDANGVLGTFAAVSGVTFPRPHYGGGTVLIGNRLYYIGGGTGIYLTDTVESAPLQ